MASTPAASNKRPLPYVDQPEAKRWQVGAASRAYDNSITRDNARAHYGDSIHHTEFHGPVHQYSERVQHTRTTLLSSCTRSEILQSLKFDEIGDRFSTINLAHAKTCHWLLEREEYKAWRNIAEVSKHNGFLWIKGKPGAGKSTLMKWVFLYAKKSHGDDALISFFFNARGGSLERSTEGMYRSLLAQVLEKIPRLQSVLDEQRQRDDWPVEVLSGLFREAVMLLGNDGLTCYIDALDECSETEVRDMIGVFEELTESATAESINFRVCFSSRHYPRISIDTCLELILEGQGGHEGDIAAYIQKKLKVSARSKSEMAVEIQKRASGIFLWVCLVVRILNEDVDRGDAGKIKTRLREIPDGLDRLFRDIITRGTRDDTHLIPTLQWIMFAQRPLNCRELYHAIIHTSNDEFGLVSEHEMFNTKNAEHFLLNSTKGLAETTKGKEPRVQFIHESVRDYLGTTGLKTLAPHLAENLPGSTHEFLKQRCLELISEGVCGHLSLPATSPATLPKAESADAEKLRARSREDLPFLEYAVSNVLFHAESACAYQVSQLDFIEGFPLATWASLNNLHERHEIRRYTSAVNLPYVLADKGMIRLLSTEFQQRDPDLSATRERHVTLLGAAVHGCHAEVVKSILEQSASKLSPASELERLLKTAAEKRASRVLELLLEAGDQPECGKILGSVLIKHSHAGNEEVVQLLLDKGADVNAQGGEYGNALQAASWGGHKEVVQQLLDKGADVNAQGGEYGNALQAASERGHKEMVQQLLGKGADVNAQGGHFGNALQAASLGGHKEIVQQLLGKGANVNAQGGFYANALYAASEKGHKEIVQQLLDKGADVNAQGGKYSNALQAALERGHLEIVQQLLDKSADVNAQGGKYSNALQAALVGGHLEIVQQLLDKGANVNAQGGDFGNALYAALVGGYKEVVQQLLGKGADVNAQGGHFGNALYAASERGHKEIVQQLLGKGADVNTQGGHFGNALQAASWGGHKEIVQQLLDKGADVNAQGGEDGNALQAASWGGHKEVVQQLLDKGADVNAQGGQYGNALQAASWGGHKEVVQQLLGKGADVNAQGGQYGNALQAASWGGHKEIVQQLRAFGA
jgi:ankyrin repeat protein